MNTTDTLARTILLAQARTEDKQKGMHRSAHLHRIDGMCTAWEHLTGETATEEALRTAAARVPVTA